MKKGVIPVTSSDLLSADGLVTILQSTYNGIVVVNRNGSIVFCNHSAERVFKREMVDLVGIELREVLPQTGIPKILETGITEVGKKIIVDGRTFIANRTPLLKDGEVIGAVGVFQDISDLEEASRELNIVTEYSDELDAIIESSYDGIYVTDGYGNTKKVNRAYERITGVTGAEVVGQNMRDLVNNGVFDQSVTLIVLKTRAQATIMQKVSSTGKDIIVTGNPIFDDNGEIKYVVTNVRDITELNGLKAQLDETKDLSERYYEELRHLRSQQLDLKGMIVVSPQMQNIIEKVQRVSQVESTVLIQGESGVGKEHIAKLIHQFSPRADGPFIKINCGAIPENLMESELFGYESGAFTGAKKGGKPGLAKLAHGGTFFIDEIGELPYGMQVKLLRLIQEKEFMPIGSSKLHKVDVRFVAATNRNLEEMVREKTFRQDLFYRLNVVPIQIPPLRSRCGDLIPLVNHFIEKFSTKYGLKKRMKPEALSLLSNYSWPGNIRELENSVEQLVVMAPGEEISADDIPERISQNSTCKLDINKPLEQTLARIEKEIISEALKQYKSMEKSAESLGIHRTTLLRKARKYGIETIQE